MSKNMKVIMENWDKFLNEEKPNAVDVFYQVCEEKEAQRQELLKEFGGAEICVGEDCKDLKGKVQALGMWGGLTGMTGIVALSALSAYALTVGGAVGVAFFVTANAPVLAIGGLLGVAYLKAKKLLPNWLKNIFSKFDKKQDPLTDEKQDPLKAAQEKIKKMLTAAQEAALVTEEQAVAILEIVNKEVHEDDECKQLTLSLLKAIDDNDSDAASVLTDKLDDAVVGVILRLQKELKAHMQQTAEEDDSPSQIEPKVRRQAQPVTASQQGDYK